MLFERGVFFYTRYTLDKSDAFNLSVAMGLLALLHSTRGRELNEAKSV